MHKLRIYNKELLKIVLDKVMYVMKALWFFAPNAANLLFLCRKSTSKLHKLRPYSLNLKYGRHSLPDYETLF